MITKICMKDINSYKSQTTLSTDKKINLIYGLNGTGKSTLSDYLYDPKNTDYADCAIEGLSDDEILVYNQSFIKDYFYQPENLKCIFTLSKENKEAAEKIRHANQVIASLDTEKSSISDEITKFTNELNNKKQNAENKTWVIKTEFSGGDRVLEYCLEGLKGKKETLFSYLENIKNPIEQPQKTIDQLKKEAGAINGSTAQKYDLLQLMKLNISSIENNQIFNKSIVGNENSTVSTLIAKLDNSDWVKEGLKFISGYSEKEIGICPFCQEKTITNTLVANIKKYFDESYENDLNILNELQTNYVSHIELLPNQSSYESNPFVLEKRPIFQNLYNAVIYCVNSNKDKIANKIKTPSQLVSLLDSSEVITNFNNFISEINAIITEHNSKIQNKETSLKNIKQQFWEIMRWKYDQTISSYKADKIGIDNKLKNSSERIKQIEQDVATQKHVIIEQQKKTVNIEEAIANINSGLIELGIDGFHIEKHTENLYKLTRNEQCDDTFDSLSEGEKMIISFLYFRELCKGERSASTHSTKRIIVIDDPISSLSHIYVFNIGQMIKNDYFNSKNYEQVFLLTHSLYFFYEMSYTSHDKREECQKMFRINKNGDGSHIFEMKYEEIQNDYHAYWYIVKDNKQPPALIANCMRNIIEYFFNFIEKEDLNNVFQQPELQETKYQAFYRYVNRESHSLGQNIFDIKEFNYDDFKEAFRLVFVKSGYEKHYKKMMKL